MSSTEGVGDDREQAFVRQAFSTEDGSSYTVKG
jgi:hypothetical protein